MSLEIGCKPPIIGTVVACILCHARVFDWTKQKTKSHMSHWLKRSRLTRFLWQEVTSSTFVTIPRHHLKRKDTPSRSRLVQWPISQKTFRAYFGGHNSLHILATSWFWAIKGRNPLSFSYIKTMWKDQRFKASRLHFDNCLLGRAKILGLFGKQAPGLEPRARNPKPYNTTH